MPLLDAINQQITCLDTAVPPVGWASPHGAQSGPTLQIKVFKYFNNYQFLKAQSNTFSIL